MPAFQKGQDASLEVSGVRGKKYQARACFAGAAEALLMHNLDQAGCAIWLNLLYAHKLKFRYIKEFTSLSQYNLRSVSLLPGGSDAN